MDQGWTAVTLRFSSPTACPALVPENTPCDLLGFENDLPELGLGIVIPNEEVLGIGILAFRVMRRKHGCLLAMDSVGAPESRP